MPEIIAEISGNHGGSIENALRLIDAAKAAGADAVKFQCFEPHRFAMKRAGVIWREKRMLYSDLYALYHKTHTPKEWFATLKRRCSWVDIPWFSSVFDPEDVAFLETLGCPRYKISAYEMLDGDLINAVKATGKPIILSVRPQDGLTILQATDYAGSAQPLGISDHSTDGLPFHNCPMVERHLRLPDVPCEDDFFSSTPEEFAAYVRAIREISA